MERATVMEDSAGQPHELLESPTIEFSSSVKQRAFIVSKLMGQKMDYQLICGYYHRLEALEATMTLDDRISSRHLEYRLLTTTPPVTPFFLTYFPNLYPLLETSKKEPNSNPPQSSIFNSQELRDIAQTSNTSNELVDANRMILNYCQSHQLTIRQFIANFKRHSMQTGLNPTVSNVAFYVKYITILEERRLQANLEKKTNFQYLNSQSPADQTNGTSNNDVTKLFKYYSNINHHSTYGRNYTVNRAEIIHDTPTVRNLFQKINANNIKKDNMYSDWVDNEIKVLFKDISMIRDKFNKECSVKTRRTKTQRKTVLENIFGVVIDDKKDNVPVGKLIDLTEDTIKETTTVVTDDLIDNNNMSQLNSSPNDMIYESHLDIPDVDCRQTLSSVDSLNLIDYSLSDYAMFDCSSSSQSAEKDISLNLTKDFKQIQDNRCSSSLSSTT